MDTLLSFAANSDRAVRSRTTPTALHETFVEKSKRKLDYGRDKHVVTAYYGKLPYSDSQGKRSPDAERHGLVNYVNSRAVNVVCDYRENDHILKIGSLMSCCDQFRTHRNTASGSKVGTSSESPRAAGFD